MGSGQNRHIPIKVGRRPDEFTLKPSGDRTWRRLASAVCPAALAGLARILQSEVAAPRAPARRQAPAMVDGRARRSVGGDAVHVGPVLNIAAIFCIFSAINVIWTLIIGAAGIFSLATMAVVGMCGYAAAAANVYLGVPWPLMIPIGAAVGFLFGLLLALPSTRLDGLYYALLTLGIAEICRVSIAQIKALAPTNSSINNVGSFIPADWYLQRPGLLLGFAASFLLLLAALLVFRLINSERLGLLLQSAREDEAFSEAIGIDYRRARWWVFVLASSALGTIGAFYAMFYRSISLAVFSLDQVLLLFAMIVIGGLGRSEGAVLGTAIVVLIDKGLIGLGPLRIILVTVIMIVVALTTRDGLTGVKAQFRAFRNRKKSERRAAQTEKGGEVMPEEATEIADKQLVYRRLFDKRLRDALKLTVTPELIAEHRAKPLGQHSDALDRLLNYFRREEMPDKYAILRVGPLKSCSYRVMALSGQGRSSAAPGRRQALSDAERSLSRGVPAARQRSACELKGRTPWRKRSSTAMPTRGRSRRATRSPSWFPPRAPGPSRPGWCGWCMATKIRTGPGFVEQEVECDIPASLQVRRQFTQVGSHAVVEDPGAAGWRRRGISRSMPSCFRPSRAAAGRRSCRNGTSCPARVTGSASTPPDASNSGSATGP